MPGLGAQCLGCSWVCSYPPESQGCWRISVMVARLCGRSASIRATRSRNSGLNLLAGVFYSRVYFRFLSLLSTYSKTKSLSEHHTRLTRKIRDSRKSKSQTKAISSAHGPLLFYDCCGYCAVGYFSSGVSNDSQNAASSPRHR